MKIHITIACRTGLATLAWADGDLSDYSGFPGVGPTYTSANPDGDAYTNEEEYIAGLNPNLFDTFAVMNFTAGASNAFEWNAVSGRIYNVYWSSNLRNGFTLIESNAPGGTFVDTLHTNAPEGFYKRPIERKP